MVATRILVQVLLGQIEIFDCGNNCLFKTKEAGSSERKTSKGQQHFSTLLYSVKATVICFINVNFLCKICQFLGLLSL